jgi:predicted permease
MSILYDVRLAIRIIIKRPLLAVISIASLAIGITANTSTFSAINALLIQVPKVRAPGDLIEIYGLNRKKNIEMISYPDYQYYRENSKGFSGILAYYLEALTLYHDGRSNLIYADIVSSNYFSLLGIDPVLGRPFVATNDSVSNAEYAVILSHKYWQSRFGSDPGILNKTITLNRHNFTVIGIAPKEFLGIQTGFVPDLWVPIGTAPQILPDFDLTDHTQRAFTVIARLSPGASVKEQRVHMETLAAQLRHGYPKTNEERGVTIGSVSTLPADVRPAVVASSWFLQIVVGVVLLIVCANVGGLLLARAYGRRGEIAVRFALGASRVRIIRQLLMESLLISLVAGVVATFLTFWVTRLLPSLKPVQFPITVDFTPDVTVLAYTLGISLLSGLLFGSLPAIGLSRLNVQKDLREGGNDSSGRNKFAFLRSLVVVQIALCLAMLGAANLCLHALQRVAASYPGFPNHNILAVRLAPKLQGYTETQTTMFFDQLKHRLEQLPDVQSISLAEHLPFDPRSAAMAAQITTSDLQEQTELEKAGKPVHYNIVGPHYFGTLGISIIVGREFTEQDKKESVKIAIINEQMAKLFWRGEDALGKSFTLVNPSNITMQVVGIAKAGKYDSDKGSPQPYFYLPATQASYTKMNILIQTKESPKEVLHSTQNAIVELDPQLPILSSETMDENLGLILFLPRITSVIFGFFGFLAFLLAVIGLYAVVDYITTQRTREIGIRIALGASYGNVLRLIVRQGFLMAALGVLVGVMPAFVCMRILSRMFYGLQVVEPFNLLLAGLVLLMIAVLASFIPARRAASLHPVSALRCK